MTSLDAFPSSAIYPTKVNTHRLRRTTPLVTVWSVHLQGPPHHPTPNDLIFLIYTFEKDIIHILYSFVKYIKSQHYTIVKDLNTQLYTIVKDLNSQLYTIVKDLNTQHHSSVKDSI